MTALAAQPEALHAWNGRMLLVYPSGATVRFDPCGRFVRPGDKVNGHVVGRLELRDERVVAVLHVR